MPIRRRQPESMEALMSHPIAVPRPGSNQIGMPTSPVELLPSGALRAPAPVLAPARALALDALQVRRALRDRARRPAWWSQPSFGRQVELVRRHLAPMRTRQALAASFGREAFHLVASATEVADPGPIRLAYALRWMELHDGATGPSWTSLLD